MTLSPGGLVIFTYSKKTLSLSCLEVLFLPIQMPLPIGGLGLLAYSNATFSQWPRGIFFLPTQMTLSHGGQRAMLSQMPIKSFFTANISKYTHNSLQQF